MPAMIESPSVHEVAVDGYELARIFRVTYPTICRQAASGRLPWILVGAERRFFVQEVRAALAGKGRIEAKVRVRK